MSAPVSPPPARWTWAVFAACLLLSVIHLTTSGALDSDLAGDPDEAAHAVTALMLRDYFAGGWLQPPMRFATAYYADFPKVALGHYPPGWYLLGGLWLLPWVSIKSLLILQAVYLAALGALLCRLASKFTSLPAAAVAGLLVAAMPLTLKQSQFVMSDLLLACLCLLSVFAWACYLHEPTVRRALSFGFIATAAILTKGSALGLCAVPIVATILTRRWALLARVSWWLSALPVALSAGPWMLYSSRITAEGMSHQSLGAFLQEAAAFYATALPEVLGWLFALLALAGLGGLLQLSGRNSRHAGLAAALWGLLVGMAAIMLLVPAGTTTRYLLPLLPALLLAAVLTADRMCATLSTLRWPVFLLLVAGGFACVAQWPEKHVSGFSAAVMRVGIPHPQPDARSESWLVVSDPRGEGAIIAAAAFACGQRSPSPLRVCRGSKELASSDWLGRGYQPAFSTAPELLRHLDTLRVSHVFLDLSVPEEKRLPHDRLLHAALQSAGPLWRLDFQQPVSRIHGETGLLWVYARTQPPPAAPAQRGPASAALHHRTPLPPTPCHFAAAPGIDSTL
ncbi:ArnT family glycosyltransferase [Prosthecobacter sp.]|uniref:ArnT family glycosyltransferase n=1 Tax=Prosthecobacter sp. TaxID=1965333 RepID=UPI0037841270